MRYKVYCKTDSKWEFFDTLMPREECPILSSHIVKLGSLTLVGESKKDYKVLRNNLIIKVGMQGFANLSLKEKKIASENFAVSVIDRDSIHSTSKQIKNGTIFHLKSIESRTARKNSAEAEIYNRILSGVEQLDLIGDVTTLLKNYVEFGIEGTLEGDNDGLFDYLESRMGTSFENTGLLSKIYSVKGMTVLQLSNRLMDIFKNGNY